jgi:chromate transporter
MAVGGGPGAAAAALATFGPPCVMYFWAYRLWRRFRDTRWHYILRRSLAPLTIGFIIAGGYVMAVAGQTGWRSIAVTVIAIGLVLRTRINPLWFLITSGALGGLGVLS